MKKNFFKSLFEKESNLQMYSINEFNVFRDIISFSKVEVYKEMSAILSDIDKKIDKQMAKVVEKYHIVMSLKSQTDEISTQLTGTEEEISVVISDSKEANIIARYSEKMRHKLLEVGFASSDLELEKKAMTVTYSKQIMMKLDNIARKDPEFVDEICKVDVGEFRENSEFRGMEEASEVKFERFNDISDSEIEDSHIETSDIEERNMEEIQEDLDEIVDDIEKGDNVRNHNSADNVDESSGVEFAGGLKINIYGEEEFASDKDNTSSDEGNTSEVDEGGMDMIDEKYSKEAYDLFVKGDDEKLAEEKKKLGEEEYDVVIRESTDMVLRDNKDKEKVGEEAYEELIKGRKIKEVEEDEY